LPFKERRRAKRFNFELPVTVRWREGSQQREAHTVTQDMSSGGVYFFLPYRIPEGTAIEVEMTVPTEITRGPSKRMVCRGRIRRCELKAGERVGVATVIEKYEFLPGTEDAA
jgi:PilZ domain